MKVLSAVILLFLEDISCARAQDAGIAGLWKTVDDGTGKTESIIEIFHKQDGKYYGTINKMLVKPVNERCIKCTGEWKDKPLLGLEVIRGLTPDKSERVYEKGSILDPKNGKVYKCTIRREGNKLHVRGYVGFSLMGRTQTWLRAE